MNLKRRKIFHAHDRGSPFNAFGRQQLSLEEASIFARQANADGRLEPIYPCLTPPQKRVLDLLLNDGTKRIPNEYRWARYQLIVKLDRLRRGAPISMTGRNKGPRPRTGRVVRQLCDALADKDRRRPFLESLPDDERRVVERCIQNPRERREDAARALGISRPHISCLRRRAQMRLGLCRPNTGFEDMTDEKLRSMIKEKGVRKLIRENPPLVLEMWYRKNILGIRLVTD